MQCPLHKMKQAKEFLWTLIYSISMNLKWMHYNLYADFLRVKSLLPKIVHLTSNVLTSKTISRTMMYNN